MNYLFVLLGDVVVVGTLITLISKMDDPSGDGQLGLGMLTFLIGGAVALITICMWVASVLFGAGWIGIPVAALLAYIFVQIHTS